MGEQFWDNNGGQNYRVDCCECEGEPGGALIRVNPYNNGGNGGNNDNGGGPGGSRGFGGARRRDSNHSDASDQGIFMNPVN